LLVVENSTQRLECAGIVGSLISCEPFDVSQKDSWAL
jgi:hypothetical protein